MAKKMYEENDIIDIADAIRAKNGTSGDANPPKYTTAQMADAIRAISTTAGGAEASTLVAHGDCGANATWEFYRDNNDGDNFGTLVIRGSGATAGYNSASDAPWYEHRDFIKSLTVDKGITEIGFGAFRNLTQLENVIISHGVTEIGGEAFSACSALKYITIPNSMAYIGTYAFSNVNNLVYILFSGTRQEWNVINKTSGNNVIKNDSKLCCNYSITTCIETIEENGPITFTPQNGQVYNQVILDVNVPTGSEENFDADTVGGWRVEVIDDGSEPENSPYPTITFVCTAR